MKDNRTYEERKQYLIKAVTKRRKQIRLKAIKHLGGKCMKCDIQNILKYLNSITKTLNKKNSMFQKKDIVEVGKGLRKK